MPSSIDRPFRLSDFDFQLPPELIAQHPRRFAAFARAAADIAGGAVKGRAFDLVHVHDWQAGLVPAYMRLAPQKGARAVPSVITIHNMASAMIGKYCQDKPLIFFSWWKYTFFCKRFFSSLRNYS